MRPRRRPPATRKIAAAPVTAHTLAPSDISATFINRRESDWLSADTPPLIDGSYVTRTLTGLCLHTWKRNRWMLARGEAKPVQWRGVDVRLTDVERQLLSNRLYHKDIVAALPLLRDATSAYLAEPENPRRTLIERHVLLGLLLRACRYYRTLERSKEGSRLLTRTDHKMLRPLIADLSAGMLQAIDDQIIAFGKGINL